MFSVLFSFVFSSFVPSSFMPEYIKADNCARCYYFMATRLIILLHLEGHVLVAESNKNMLRDFSLFWMIDAGICRNNTAD